MPHVIHILNVRMSYRKLEFYPKPSDELLSRSLELVHGIVGDKIVWMEKTTTYDQKPINLPDSLAYLMTPDSGIHPTARDDFVNVFNMHFDGLGSGALSINPRSQQASSETEGPEVDWQDLLSQLHT